MFIHITTDAKVKSEKLYTLVHSLIYYTIQKCKSRIKDQEHFDIQQKSLKKPKR